MVRRILISSYKKLIWVITSTVISYGFALSQAGCINVPSFNIDLTGNPNATWISPPVVRANQCCGLSNPERCVEFILTLDPSTEAISLGIISGAIPGGALFYQINCGPQNPINQPVCISGVGPHYVTFCKPGNNENVYEISAIAQPELSDDLTLNDGCAGEIFVSGLDPASINWTTVAPGAPGAYNHYLSCTSGCSNVAVQSQGNPPPYIDVEVSGSAIGNCSGILFRDTVRISFVPALFVQIEPENPTVCFGEPNAIISAMASGGSEPYEFLWNTGETSQSISAGPGVYSVQLSDASGCPPVLATMEVFGFDQEILANAGNDISMCVADISVNLNGQVQGAGGGIWLGGSGSFSPNNQTLNATYTPSLSELDNGIAVLILETTENGGCPAHRDTLTIYIYDYQEEDYNVVICQGEEFSVHGFTYNSTGAYNEVISNQFGCDSIVLSVNLTVNDFVVENYNPIICQGEQFSVHGFTYNSTGVYSEVIQDQNGCDSIVLSVNLTVNDFVVENYNPIICQGEEFSVHGFTYNASGVYNEVIQDQNGCDSIVLSINLTVNDFVVETYSPVICQGESFSVHGYTFNTSGFYQQILFHQSGCDSVVFSVELTVNPSHSTTENVTICSSEIHELPDGSLVNASGTYRVNLQNAFGCDSVIITNLHVNMLGSHQPLNDLSLCESGNFSIQIEAENMVNYEWMMHVEELGWVSLANNPNFSGVNSNQLQFYLNTSLHNRDFIVHMTDECGNNYEESMHLNVFEPLPIDNKLDDLYFCDHEIETIRANYDGYDFEWNNGTLGQYITPDKPGEYIVSFTQFETGCRVIDTILIEIENCIEKCVVLAPTGFTPDGNGKNDIFRVVTSCDEGFSHFRLNVHNRWGELVYQTENPTDGWDGNYKGKTAEIGVYSFFVEYSKHYSQKHELIKGNVTLIR
jgi:gliding motility-associated-like protein